MLPATVKRRVRLPAVGLWAIMPDTGGRVMESKWGSFVYALEDGRWIVCTWDRSHCQYQTHDIGRSSRESGFFMAFAGSVESLARETGRRYKTRAQALAVARRLYDLEYYEQGGES